MRPPLEGAELHHVGIVVPSIERALPLYRDVLGLRGGRIRDLPDQGVRAVMLSAGGSRIELLEPTDVSSGVARFLARSARPTLHHVCFAVDDLRGILADLAAAGTELVDREPRPGIAGLVAFLHPRAGDGVLIELLDRGTIV